MTLHFGASRIRTKKSRRHVFQDLSLSTLQRSIDVKSGFNSEHSKGNTRGNMMQVSELLKHHQLADVKSIDKNGNTMLHLAIINEKFTPKETIEVLELLLDKGVNPDIENKNKETVLHLAIKKRAKDIVELLLAREVKLDFLAAKYLINDERGKFSELENHLNILDSKIQRIESESSSFTEWIVAKGLDIDGVNRWGSSALHSAISDNLLHILPVLLMHTKNIDYTEEETESTLLHLFLERSSFILCCRSTQPSKNWYSNYHQRYALKILKVLLDRGISPEVGDESGDTALHIAIAKKANIDLIQMLLKYTRNVNHRNKNGMTPFYNVFWNWRFSRGEEPNTDYYLQIARDLIAKGADVNIPYEDGKTPLAFVMQDQLLLAVEFLRENGADFSATTEDNETLMHLLIANRKNYDINEELEIKLFDLLISNGCPVEVKNKSGMTPLHIAANGRNMALVPRLLKHGADVNSRNTRMETPLIYLATYNKDLAMAKFLLEQGANVNARDFEGFTALHATAVGSRTSDSNVRMLTFLLEHGADFHARVHEGHSVIRMGLWRDYNEDAFGEDVIEPDELPSLMDCIEDWASAEVQVLLKHHIKINVLKGATDDEHKSLMTKKTYKACNDRCLREIEKLKSIPIDSSATLYTLLHMNPNRRRAYINNEELGKWLHSSKLKQQFPEYSVLIRASYHEAVTRKALLVPARKAWLELTEIWLPEVCLELVFSFLSNAQLFDFIEKH